MTPLHRLLSRHLPPRAVAPAMALLYAAAILAVLTFARSGATDIVYIDLEGMQ